VPKLLDAISHGDAECLAVYESGDTARARALLVPQIRRDFASGRVIVLENWMLSITEGRLCALVALT
jgi:hypothetical protein